MKTSRWGWFVPPELPGRASVGILLLRLYAGVALALHGWPKIQTPFHWMDRMPGAAPGALQALAALSEFGGGIALALGFLTPLAAFGVACTMARAVTVHVGRGDPFVGRGGSYEPALGYLLMAVLFFAAGPGRYSLDPLLFRARRPD